MAIVEGIVSNLVGGLVVNVLTKLGTDAIRQFGAVWGVNKEVQRLRETVVTIQDYLADAEQKQLTHNKVGSWLTRIKDAVYDAEDIIDEFLTEAERRRLAKQDKIFETSKPLFGFRKSRFGFRLDIARRIKQVRETLGRIKDDQPSGLIPHIIIREQNSEFIQTRPETHSHVGEVFGRDEERDQIVKLLLDSSGGGGDTVSFIPIIGMGGLGKTTFAKYLYNHHQVVDHFKDNRWWVCVSNDNREVNAVQTITKKIIESVTGEKCPDLQMDLLRTRLGGHIGGKRFLLVLDDVWNEDANQWWELKGLLSGGASGSKILVTTRSGRVGSITSINSNSECKLSGLSDDHCWELFKSRAFNKVEDQPDPELEDIGRAIVRKCGGLPLAARVLGGLCCTNDKQIWENVRDNEIWTEENGILPELMISYNYLPIQLKQCFAYCSIFPKNYPIKKNMLIQYWITHGLIYPSGDNKSLEDVGNDYIKRLMWRSFFQEVEFDDYDNLLSFKMHDLVNDLAKSVAGVEFFTVCKDVEKFPEGVRHLFFDIKISSSHITKILEPSKIRTLVFSSEIENFDGDTFSRLKFLRVLQFSDDCIKYLPNSIGNLKFLRYLQIECGNIKELPESITNLQNLQVLNLECEMLKRLPESIKKMISLKHIYLRCPLLSHMPLGIKELTSLKTLSCFIVSNDNVGCELNGLNGLINLGGVLRIEDLDNVKNVKESENTNLKTKSNLQCLELYWRGRTENTNGDTVDFEVLRNLEPYPNLKYLFMEGYKGTSFPGWMMDPLPSLSKVVKISLENCKRCEKLPPFRRLPSLKVLELRKISSARCFEDSLEQSSRMEWFPSLTKLVIDDAPNLESWVAMEKQEEEKGLFILISFPRLVSLKIMDCPKLKSMPLLPSLVDLKIRNCPNLKSMPPLPPSVEDLTLDDISAEVVQSIWNPNSFSVAMEQPLSLSNLVKIEIRECRGCKQLPPFSRLPSLKSLQLFMMHDLQCFEGELEASQKEWFPSLTHLTIWGAPKLESWVVTAGQQQQQQQGLSLSFSFPRLVFLIIFNCPKLKNMPPLLRLPCIEYVWLLHCSGEVVHSVFNPTSSLVTLKGLGISSCDDLECLPEYPAHYLSSLEYLTIGDCESLKSWPNWLGHQLTSLRKLETYCSSKLQFLPEQIQHLTALQELKIVSYSEETLPDSMENLTSLLTLELRWCPNLQILPEWVLRVNTTIQSLVIDRCPLLKVRYNKETGEDRDKLTHIKSVDIR